MFRAFGMELVAAIRGALFNLTASLLVLLQRAAKLGLVEAYAGDPIDVRDLV